ncbi:MAG: c-type cytochrome [Acidobacteriota bacterium]|nr:c-type cytochrome [Acidobacteriota bacterium]
MRSGARNILLLLSIALLTACNSEPKIDPASLTERERDGFVGDVRAVLTGDVVLSEENGKWTEAQQASSTTIYDAAGKRTLQTPFRVVMTGGFAITPHELFFDPTAKRNSGNAVTLDNASKKYIEFDGNGNVLEKGSHEGGKKTLKELSIRYEFDVRGNWIKRTLYRLTDRNGQKELLPTEISYRQIVYADSPKASQPPELIPASAKQLKSSVAATDENLESGRALFLQRCSACHGESGNAQTDFAEAMPTKPADLKSPQVAALTEGEIYTAINDGLKVSSMPGFKNRLSDEAIWKLALYVKKLSREAANNQTTLAKASPTPVQPTAKPEAEKRYTLKGKVTKIERDLKQVVIEHEEVKGYMEAMTMPFPLTDERALSKLKVGDKIEATLVVGVGMWRLENVVIK